MNRFLLIFFASVVAIGSVAQGVKVTDGGAANTEADEAAILELESSLKGFLPPRMSTAQRDQISTPVPEGLQIYNTDIKCIQFYNGASWKCGGNCSPDPPQAIFGADSPWALSGMQQYSIDPMSGVSAYAWTVPFGWSILDGQNSTTLTVAVGGPGQDGYISVSATNECGMGAPQSLYVSPGDACEGITPPNPSGKIYGIIGIGSQCWFSENLDEIPTHGVGSCYLGDNANCTTYGRLYNWDAVMSSSSASNGVPSGVQGICPSGWHVPSAGEFDILIDFLGGAEVAGGKLKSSSGLWAQPNLTDEISSGFDALPGGIRRCPGSSWQGIQDYTYWRTTSVTEANETLRTAYGVNAAESTVMVQEWETCRYLSVRCVKD